MELGYITKLFYKNGYPKKLISFVIQNKEHKAVNPTELIMTASKKPAYSSIPFIFPRNISAIKKNYEGSSVNPHTQVKLPVTYISVSLITRAYPHEQVDFSLNLQIAE